MASEYDLLCALEHDLKAPFARIASASRRFEGGDPRAIEALRHALREASNALFAKLTGDGAERYEHSPTFALAQGLDSVFTALHDVAVELNIRQYQGSGPAPASRSAPPAAPRPVPSLADQMEQERREVQELQIRMRDAATESKRRMIAMRLETMDKIQRKWRDPETWRRS